MPVNRITKPQTINNMPKEKIKKRNRKDQSTHNKIRKFRTDSEAGMKNETNSYFSWSNNNRERTKHSIISK